MREILMWRLAINLLEEPDEMELGKIGLACNSSEIHIFGKVFIDE